MISNDVKKGMRVRLRSGLEAVMYDSAVSDVRMATVEGIVDELGSIYAYEIEAVQTDSGWERVTPTQSQRDINERLMGFWENTEWNIA